MWKWFKAQNFTTKMMIVLGVCLLVGVVTRWEYVSHETREAFRKRFTIERSDTTTLPRPDTVLSK